MGCIGLIGCFEAGSVETENRIVREVAWGSTCSESEYG